MTYDDLRALVPMPLYAVCLGAGLWTYYHPRRIAEHQTNKLDLVEREQGLRWVAIAFLALALVYAVTLVVARLRRGPGGALGALGTVNRGTDGLG